MAPSSSGLGHLVLIQEIVGSNPTGVTKKVMASDPYQNYLFFLNSYNIKYMRQGLGFSRKLLSVVIILAFLGFIAFQFYQHKRSLVLGPVFLSIESCREYKNGCPIGTFCQEIPMKIRSLPTETHGCRVLIAQVFDFFGIKKATRLSRTKYSATIDSQLPQEIKDCIVRRVNSANEHELVLGGDRMIITLKEKLSSDRIRTIISEYKLQAAGNLDFVNAFVAIAPTGKIFETACWLEKDTEIKSVEFDTLSVPF